MSGAVVVEGVAQGVDILISFATVNGLMVDIDLETRLLARSCVDRKDLGDGDSAHTFTPVWCLCRTVNNSITCDRPGVG